MVSSAKRGHVKNEEPRVRINTVIIGEPARWLLGWKRVFLFVCPKCNLVMTGSTNI